MFDSAAQSFQNYKSLSIAFLAFIELKQPTKMKMTRKWLSGLWPDAAERCLSHCLVHLFHSDDFFHLIQVTNICIVEQV